MSQIGETAQSLAQASPEVGRQILSDFGIEWCQTNAQFKLRNPEAPLNASCYVGDCDNPVNRNPFIPGGSTPIKTINLRFHVFRNSDGSNPAASVTDVANQVAQMNSDYAASRIAFTYTMRFVDSTTYRSFSDSEETAMKNAYAQSPATQLNVYVVNINAGYLGVGTFPWDAVALTSQGGLIVDDSWFGAGQKTMTHEAGHCLGLWHTHHGVSEVTTCSTCYERANGADGDGTGDFCSDTPPTPVNFNCSGPGGSDPCSSTLWGPTAPQNYMGYASDACYSEFTSQQDGRMHCWITSALSGWLATPNNPPNTPSLSNPPNGQTGTSLTPTLSASAFSDPDSGDTHASSEWQVDDNSGFTSPAWDYVDTDSVKTSHTVPAATLTYSTLYYWRVRYKDNHGTWSNWAASRSFTTQPNTPPNTPSLLSPSDGQTGISLTPTLSASAFSDPGDTHSASQWLIDDTSDFSSPVWDYNDTDLNKTSHTVPAATLTYSTLYYWRVRYKDNHDAWSNWSSSRQFTTDTPPDTPSLLSPPNGQTGVSLTPTLTASAFSDPDSGDTHASSQWQVDDSSGFTSPAWDHVDTDSIKTSDTVPAATLSYETLYYWRVRYKDNQGAWSNWSSSRSFTTRPAPTTIASENLDSDPGWTTEGDWAFGVPAGLSGDPTSGYTGSNVYGYNLNGAYPNNLPETSLTSTAFDCRGYENVALDFYRWLRIESAIFDHAKIQISTDGINWDNNVWVHTGSTLLESAWSHQSYDISAVADNQPTVYLRWVMGTTDVSVTYGGWNIDDISLVGDQIGGGDALAPAVSIAPPTRTYARTGHQVNFDVYYDGADSVTLSDADVTLVKHGDADADVYVTGSGTYSRKVRLLNLRGNGLLSIALAPGTASDSSGNMAGGVTESAQCVIDNWAPQVYMTPPSEHTVSTGPLNFTTFYSGAWGIVLTPFDVVMNRTSSADALCSIFGTGRYRRRINLHDCTGQGRINIALMANTAYDQAGNLAAVYGPTLQFRVDNVPPYDESNPEPRAYFSPPTRWFTDTGKVVKYTVYYLYADAISLTESDVTLNTFGTANAQFGVSGTGRYQRTITLYNLTGEGQLAVSLVPGTAANQTGKPALGIGPSPWVEVDDTPPGLYITSPNPVATANGPATYTILYSDAFQVMLTNGHVSLLKTGSANGTVNVSGAGRSKRKVRIENIVGNGNIGIQINAGTAIDRAGNLTPAAASEMQVVVTN